MSRTTLKCMAVTALSFLLLPLFAAAQESSQQEAAKQPPPAIYRLDYVIQELDNGKRINERKYSLSARAGGRGCQVRVGRQVPVAVDSTPSGEQKHIQYMHVGMDLDCSLREQDGQLTLDTTVEMSSVVTGGGLALQGAPVTRNARTSMTTLVTTGKPTVIGTLDDVDSTRSYQIEVTVTRMK